VVSDPVAPDAAMPADWTGIPGPRSAPEAGRVPRDCHPVPVAAEPEPMAEPESDAPAEPDAAGRHDGLAALESMLAGAELLLVGCGEEEEAW